MQALGHLTPGDQLMAHEIVRRLVPRALVRDAVGHVAQREHPEARAVDDRVADEAVHVHDPTVGSQHGAPVGAVERGQVLPRPDVAAGDVILGLPSSGVHSNGYSLVRRIVSDSGLAWTDPAPFDLSRSLAEALLVPTRIYVRSALAAQRATGALKALAHITGGGFWENIPRVLPVDKAAPLKKFG